MMSIKKASTVTVLGFILWLGATPVRACPLCESETGQRVRAGIFNADFGHNLVVTLLPFPLFLGIIYLIYSGPPWPKVALVTAGAEMDVLGLAFDQFADEQREAVVAVYPRGGDFKNEIIRAFYEGMKHRPETTFGTVNDDVLAHFDPGFQRTDFCSVILQSSWRA
jgi:hypothetical protein